MVCRLSVLSQTAFHQLFAVTLGGAGLFIIFAFIYFYEVLTYVDPYLSPDPTLHSPAA